MEGLGFLMREATSVVEGRVEEVKGQEQVRAGRDVWGLVAVGLDSSPWIPVVFMVKKDSSELQKRSERGGERERPEVWGESEFVNKGEQGPGVVDRRR